MVDHPKQDLQQRADHFKLHATETTIEATATEQQN